MLWDGRSGVRSPLGAGDLSFLLTVQTESGVHAATYSEGNGTLSWGKAVGA
jgi:hypothetical protein